MEFTKEMETMTTGDHCKGSERGHERSNQDRFDRRLAEIEVQLEVMEQLLQRKVDANQRRGWSMKKPVQWPVVQLFIKKLRKILREMKHRSNALKKKEKLRGVEFRFRPLTEKEGFHYCEPEQGDILGEDDVERRSIVDLTDCLENEEEERLAGSLMSSLKSSDQHMDMLTSKAERPNVFISDILCVVADLAGEVVNIQKEEKEMYKNISSRQDQKLILMEDEATMPHEDNQGGAHMHVSKEANEGQLQKFIVAENEVRLSQKDSQEEYHTLPNKWTAGRQSEEFIAAENKVDLAHEDGQREIEEEECFVAELLEKLLKKSESGGEANQRIDVAFEQRGMVLEASAETLESHGFKSNHWYVVAGIEGREGRHIQNFVIKEERGQHSDIVQQQQRCRAIGQLPTKVWDPGGFH
jgi:hypothetical protein